MFYLYAQLEPKGARTRPNWTQVSNGEWFYLKKKSTRVHEKNPNDCSVADSNKEFESEEDFCKYGALNETYLRK